MRHFIKFHGEAKRSVNGKVVEDSIIDSEYNGKNLYIDERKNNEFKHVVINDKDIKHLLNKPMHKINLVDRLMRDYDKSKKYKKKQRTVNKQRTVKKKLRKHIIKHTIKNRFK